MLKVLILNAFFCCCLAAGRSSESPHDEKEVFECRGRSGYVAEGCGDYYYCLSNGTHLTFRCPAGSGFNLRNLMCEQMASCMSDADLKRSLRIKLKRGKKFPDKPRIRLHNPDDISQGTAIKEFRKANLRPTAYKFKTPSKKQKNPQTRKRYNPSVLSSDPEGEISGRIIPFKVSRSNVDYYREVMSPPESPPKEFANREKHILTSPSHHSFIFTHERFQPFDEAEIDEEQFRPTSINLGIKPKHARTYHKARRHHHHHSIQKRQTFEEYLNKPFNFDGAASTSNDFGRFPYSLPEPFQSFFRGPNDKDRANPFTMDFTQSFPTRNSEESDEVAKSPTEATQQSGRQPVNTRNFAPSRIAGASTPNSFYPPLPSIRPPRNQIPQYHRPPFQPTEFNNFEELYPYLQKNFPYAYSSQSTTAGPQLERIVEASDKENVETSKNAPEDEKMFTLNIVHGPTQMPMVKPPTLGPLMRPPSIPRPPVAEEEPRNTRRRVGRRRPTKAPASTENVAIKNNDNDFEPLAPLREIPLPEFKPETFEPNFPIQNIDAFDNQFKNLAQEEKMSIETETRKPFRSEMTTPMVSFHEMPTTRPTRPPQTRPPQRSRPRATPPPPPPPRAAPPPSHPAPIKEPDFSSLENEADVRVPFGARIRSGGRKAPANEPKPKPAETVRRPPEPAAPPRRRPEAPMIQRELPSAFIQPNIEQVTRQRPQPRQPAPQEPPRNLVNSQEERRMTNRDQQSVRSNSRNSPSRSASRQASSQTNQPMREISANVEPKVMPQRSRQNNQRLTNSRTSSRFRANDSQNVPQSSEEMQQRPPQRNQRKPNLSPSRNQINQQSSSLEENESIRAPTSRENMRNQRRTSQLRASRERQESQENKSVVEPDEDILAQNNPRQARRNMRPRNRQPDIPKQSVEPKIEKDSAEQAQGIVTAKRKRIRRPRPGNKKSTETSMEANNTTPLQASHVEYMEEEGQRPFPAEVTSTTTAPEPTTQAGRVFTALSGGNMLNKRPRILPPRLRTAS